MGSESPQFGAFPWDDSYKFVNSHCGELTALWHYVERSTASSCLLLWVSDNQAAVYGVNKVTCKPEEGLAILSLILTRCDSLGIVLLAFWVPRELNRVSDYLSHLSVLVRSDVTGSFTADSAEVLATTAAGVLDDSVVSARARATGVAADSVEQVMQGAGSRRRPQEFHSQAPHRGSISQRVHSGQSPPLSPVRDIDLNVLCPACDAQRGQLPEPRDLFGSSAAGISALLDQPWLSSGEQIRVDRLVKVLRREDLPPNNGSSPYRSITCNDSLPSWTAGIRTNY